MRCSAGVSPRQVTCVQRRLPFPRANLRLCSWTQLARPPTTSPCCPSPCAVFKAGAFVPPVVTVTQADLGAAAGTPDSPFSLSLPLANLPEPNKYSVRVAGINANGAGPYSAMSKAAVFGE